ncbi:hypothetical protein [Brucella sp. NBRC 12953]
MLARAGRIGGIEAFKRDGGRAEWGGRTDWAGRTDWPMRLQAVSHLF